MKFRGAEAIVETIDWHGAKAVSKVRNRRGYRHPSLEKRLVLERLRSESRIMEKLLSAGIPVPALYSVNSDANTIIMEYIDGVTLEQALRGQELAHFKMGSTVILLFNDSSKLDLHSLTTNKTVKFGSKLINLKNL